MFELLGRTAIRLGRFDVRRFVGVHSVTQELFESLRSFTKFGTATVDNSQGSDEFHVGQVRGNQTAGRQFASDRRRRQQRDAGIDLDGLLQGLDIVKLHHDVHLDLLRRQSLVDFMPNLEIAVKAHKRLAGQIRDRHARLSTENILTSK